MAMATGFAARKLLYGAASTDLWALSFAFAVLAATGLLATLLPAYRAASIDPMESLRRE
jgi:ABC-type antimicrobial peptide transport system permease subunit